MTSAMDLSPGIDTLRAKIAEFFVPVLKAPPMRNSPRQLRKKSGANCLSSISTPWLRFGPSWRSAFATFAREKAKISISKTLLPGHARSMPSANRVRWSH